MFDLEASVLILAHVRSRLHNGVGAADTWRERGLHFRLPRPATLLLHPSPTPYPTPNPGSIMEWALHSEEAKTVDYVLYNLV